MDIPRLRRIIRKYRYGREYILDRDLSIEVDYYNRCAKLGSFISYGRNQKTGCCAELMCSLFSEIGEKLPKYHRIRVTGRDNGYFSEPESSHSYLLLFDHNPMGKMKIVSNPSLINS